MLYNKKDYKTYANPANERGAFIFMPHQNNLIRTVTKIELAKNDGGKICAFGSVKIEKKTYAVVKPDLSEVWYLN